MKCILPLLLLSVFASTAESQRYVDSIDLRAKINLFYLPEDRRLPFKKLLEQRKVTDIYRRLDTASFRLAYIEESYCALSDSMTITERYFNDQPITGIDESWQKKIPNLLFINGRSQSPLTLYFSDMLPNGMHYGLIDDYYTKENIISKSDAMQRVQELQYDSLLAWEGTQEAFAKIKKELTTRAIKELSETWKIVTLIDFVNKKMIVSLQLPATNPSVTYRCFQRMFDW